MEVHLSLIELFSDVTKTIMRVKVLKYRPGILGRGKTISHNQSENWLMHLYNISIYIYRNYEIGACIYSLLLTIYFRKVYNIIIYNIHRAALYYYYL